MEDETLKIFEQLKKMCLLMRDVGADDDQYLMVKLADMEKILALFD